MSYSPEIFLDMDGVLSDFHSAALRELNAELGQTYTARDYAEEYGEWGIHTFYNITEEYFWEILEGNCMFWLDIDPYPWAKELYEYLLTLGNVTIVTSPNHDPICLAHKIVWLNMHLGVDYRDVVLTNKKYLLSGNGILIDDNKDNVKEFILNDGDAILVPSNWNVADISLDKIIETIELFMDISE